LYNKFLQKKIWNHEMIAQDNKSCEESPGWRKLRGDLRKVWSLLAEKVLDASQGRAT